MAGFTNWQAAVLKAAGLPVTQANIDDLSYWQRAEGGSASNNPMNTTQPAPGARSYNSVGVRNYTSPQQGAEATAQTLRNGHYANILAVLSRGNATPQQLGSAVAQSPWGTGSGILRLIGKGPLPAAPSSAALPAAGAGAPQLPGVNPYAAALLQQISQGGQQNAGLALLSMAMQRQQAGAAQQTYGPQPTTGPLIPHGHGAQFVGDTQGEKPHFLTALAAAGAAVGGTKIRVTSGYRSPQHNAAVGGVQGSNHTTGDAMDGDLFIPGRGWVPLGVALQGVAGKYGLRSGNVAGFFNGNPDPVHVDDGSNVH